MLLEHKYAIVYEGEGSVGAVACAFACAFAREGAKVFLAGRTRESLEGWPRRLPRRAEWPRRRKSTLPGASRYLHEPCSCVLLSFFTRTRQRPRPKIRAGTLRTSGTRDKRRSQRGGARGCSERSTLASTRRWIWV